MSASIQRQVAAGDHDGPAPQRFGHLEHVNGFEAIESENVGYIETLYEQYLADPTQISTEWHDYFQMLAQATGGVSDSGLFKRPAGLASNVAGPLELEAAIQQERVDQLLRNYRAMGHYAAAIDPLDQPREIIEELNPYRLGFTEKDLDRHFSTHRSSGPNVRTLREILAWLQNTYCRSIGAQFMHIDDLEVREWLQTRMEASENRIQLELSDQRRILERLTEAAVFESFILEKFQGAKSFSLEGAETLIPLLDSAISKAADCGVEEIILGMAHRGRLNVLANIMGKQPRAIFREFADLDGHLNMGRGDVKYHLGYSSDWVSPTNQKVHLSLCFNPSHLEFVNGVAMGRVRAKQDKHQDTKRERVMCLLIHGDAAFAGEGIIQETLNLSQLEATAVGGTIHVIVNNQIGFTTGPNQARSTSYASDVAKMLQIPIFHVNGEDPEAVAQVVDLALEFRKQFKRDVVIDMYCFRRRGHNETDEPRFTQPLMYQFIDKREAVGERYLPHLVRLGGVTGEEGQLIAKRYRERLDAELKLGLNADYVHNWDAVTGAWTGFAGGPEGTVPDVETGIPVDRAMKLLASMQEIPEGFHPHPRLNSMVLDARRQMATGKQPLNWAAGELLAFASLLTEGHIVRLHGQDVERGTFSTRHAVLHDVMAGKAFCSLNALGTDQAKFHIHNSMLSEAGVLGFEYGYSLDTPSGLICWEAQFGDFSNVAQVIIDQFIVSAEDKWNRLSGLVMLLPHGFEGQGPEHSSARLERFLNLCAEDNIQVVYPSTPAQHFHLLRRQVLKKWRKPLIVMTPKSMLRLPKASSGLDEFATGTFQRVLADPRKPAPGQVKQIILCSGKVYYDLDDERERLGRQDVAIIRVEQLYPLAAGDIARALAEYPVSASIRWVQEEPENMGAWWFWLAHWDELNLGGRRPSCAARAASASPATGSKKSHELEHKQLMAKAFAP